MRTKTGTKKAISIRFSLLRSFFVLILISSLTVLILMSIRAHRTEAELSEKLINKGMLQATQELNSFFQPVNKNTLLAERWGLAGKLNLAEVVAGPPRKISAGQLKAVSRINSLLMPLMLLYPDMSSLQVANARGDGFLLIRLESGLIRNRVVSRERWGTKTLWFDLDQSGQPHSPEWKEVDYEPRKRSWYTGVQSLPYGEVFWTEPYRFFTTKDLGITASVRWNSQGTDYVFAVDVLLASITDFTRRDSTQLTSHSQTAIYTRDWRVVGLPRHEKFQSPEALHRAFLLSMDEIQIPELMAAVQKADTTPEIGEHIKESGKTIFSYECRGETWWAGVNSYPLGKSRQLWIGILVPNNDLLEGITQLRLYLLAATIVALLAALAYSILLARSYSKPLEALAAQSRSIRDLDFQADKKIEATLREFKELEEAQAQSLAALQSFAHYVPMEVVRELVRKGEVARIGGQIKTLTVLFTDIAGFTKISESMSPEALTNHMAEYFQEIIDTLHKHLATVDKIVGDAIVAFWGAPAPVPQPADKAIQAVIECRDHLMSLNAQWLDRGLPPLATRFGLATGPVVVGNIGARTRLAYTVLGDTVNLASRLEGLNKMYGSAILVDESTRQACGEAYEWRHLDRIVVVGKTEPTEIYEVLGQAGTVSEEVLAGARRYEAAWAQYRSRNFQEALQILHDFEEEFGPDVAMHLLRVRCKGYSKSPPEPDWDGTSKMTLK